MSLSVCVMTFYSQPYCIDKFIKCQLSFYTQCFMDLFIVMFSKKKNLMNIDALVPIQTKLKLRHYNLWKV